ncbi:MAG: tetratricopeptide repeat protein [Solobacterium sp.]|nr:tetratricopeptide repeat protein [Solobacterium sp.]
MSNRNRIILIIVAALAIGVIGFSAYFGLKSGNSSSYKEHIAEAEKYIEYEDYENAILAYERILEKDPDNVDAYLGIAECYAALGDIESAVGYLRQGYARTRSAKLDLALAEYEEELDGSGTTSKDDVDNKQGGTTVLLNTDAFRMFGGNNYNDYLRSGIESPVVSNQIANVRLQHVDATVHFTNTETQPDALDGTVINGDSYPYLIEVDNAMSLFGGGYSITYDVLSSLNLPDLRIVTHELYGNAVTFNYSGCIVTIESDSEGTVTFESRNSIVPEASLHAASELEDVKASVTGHVIDAQTGEGVPYASIAFHADNQVGVVMETVETESDGSYSVELEPGFYIAEVSCDEYVTIYSELDLGSAQTEEEKDFIITKETAEGEIRVVLEWGTYPNDLDSHMVINGTDVYFANKEFYSGGTLVAELDHDDVDGVGPETITLHDSSFSFRYFIHNFSRTGDIGVSGARVTIYLPGESPITVDIDSSISGDYWNVFTYENGQINIQNSAG